ncbi:MAG: hypothetical protein ACXWQQ_15035, partial [Pseudobdellovibrio sp.]
YERRGFFNIPSFKFGTPVSSAAERGRFLYRDRDKLLTMPKAKDEFRIFILGGSVAFGEGASNNEARWFVQLEKILREKTHKNIVIIPAANHSHVTTQERVIFELYVSPFEPDAIVVLDGFNDANTGISATRPGDPYAQSIIYVKDESPLYGFINDLSKHSELIRYGLQQEIFSIWFGKHPTQEERSSQSKSVANVYFDNLTQLNRRCKNEKIKCLFLLQPFWDQTLINRKLTPQNKEQMIMENYVEIRKEISNYPFVTDFTGVFDDGPKEVPFIDPAHFNDEGHLYMAEKIADLILAKKIVN